MNRDELSERLMLTGQILCAVGLMLTSVSRIVRQEKREDRPFLAGLKPESSSWAEWLGSLENDDIRDAENYAYKQEEMF